MGTGDVGQRGEYSDRMAGDFGTAETVIRAEYARLCNCLGLLPIPLDVYVSDPDAGQDVKTPLGSPLVNAEPCYSGTKRLMVLPLCDGNDWPAQMPAFPPTDWSKHASDWPIWRIELWHEVVHQVSNDVLRAWDPKEPGRKRPDGSTSQQGHGVGWFKGVCYVAARIGAQPEELDALLDR